MASDYQAIRRDNERRYGTDIGRIGPMLLADRYDDRTHFIFELLQNAEDALARRHGWQGCRSVSFHLTDTAMRVEHLGKPFDDADVRGICGIAESTKGLTEIGRFGIGFKSVYAVTTRPEIHSGAEAFAIESFVWPVAAPAIERDPDATVIVLPFPASEEGGRQELACGLTRLGPSTLLFLHQIEEIRWSIESGRSGLYLRESKPVTPGVRRVTIIGQELGASNVAEEWLVFSRPVFTTSGQPAGHVELAFLLTQDDDTEKEHIARVERSPLVVYFPTVLETHLGFLIQGPYRTTPSRDNVPRADSWNKHLVAETATLLREALCWLRDNGLFDTAALRCLPLDPAKFGESSMFEPLCSATKTALSTDKLLPRFDVGHVQASRARLGRTQELRQLFTPAQLGSLYGEEGELVWLSSDITQDRTPELRRYLMQELGVKEITPDDVVSPLTKHFLEAQSDDWIVCLYEFLNGQPALRRRFEQLPLVRLEDGAHVQPHRDGQPQAFLPGAIASGFPLVRAATCKNEKALEFLRSLRLTEPDPVDDVVRNVTPKYKGEPVEADGEEYNTDIKRILNAYATQHRDQRNKLIEALREARFVRTVDAGDGSQHLSKPGGVYLATERLKELFAGVSGVMLVDDSYSCLKGEGVRELLEACGAVRYLRPMPDSTLSREERSALRKRAGHAHTSGQNDCIHDYNLLGLKHLLEALPKLTAEERYAKARLIWEELANLEERRGKDIFAGEYTWTYYGSYRATFDAAFVRDLNKTAWIPDQNGDLQMTQMILFDSLGWPANPFLLSKIRFKPPILDQLAKEAGIEPGVLDLLKKLGVTSEADLRARLGVKEDAGTKDGKSEDPVADALKKLLGDAPEPTPAVPEPGGPDPVTSGSGKGGDGRSTGKGLGGEPTATRDGQGHDSKGRGSTGTKRTPGATGGPPFISYVAVHPEDEEPDPDGLDYAARVALEAKAIELILSREPEWRRTPTHNPGFDLYQGEEPDRATRWCEVKAMTGRLADRPVGLSHTQFDCARDHGEAYWLYVVERAGTDEARVVRIQDPAGKAGTYTFDHGWLAVAEIDPESEEPED